MVDVRETPDFTNWLAALSDQRARLQIVRRISRVAGGNFGDAKSVGGAVNELRIDHGPGYRVYYTRPRQGRRHPALRRQADPEQGHSEGQGNRWDIGWLMMKVNKLKKFDAAEHLRTPEARAEYLNIVLADGDPAEVRDALNLVARAQGMSVVAKAAGVTREGLYKTLGENGNPEFATVLRVIAAMGIRLVAEPARAKPKKKAVA
jgi:probable addiction module antidote protein/putative addiction module killer protein